MNNEKLALQRQLSEKVIVPNSQKESYYPKIGDVFLPWIFNMNRISDTLRLIF
ncbi:MAG: hypothetical protein HC803_08685 [Saprospiraceae bacterium]|nr:hypothetical protein [Saprospiraceae bacterium]